MRRIRAVELEQQGIGKRRAVGVEKRVRCAVGERDQVGRRQAARLGERQRRSANEPRVKAEARRLALLAGELDPALSESERAVAVRLASSYLDASLAELLPRAVSQPSLRPQLELVARCRAALATGKRTDDLEDADLSVLDERVARYLGGSWSEGVQPHDDEP